MRKYLQRWFIKFLVKDIFHTISPDDIFKVKEGKWTFKGKEMDSEVVARLKIQAANFKESTLWQILKTELQWSAAKALMERGSSETDIRVAQIQGYLTQVVDKKLEDLTK